MAIDRSAILHVLRAVHEITGRKAFVLIGSAAVVAHIGEEHLTVAMTGTEDVDLYAIDASDPDEFSSELDIIGIGSQFHATNSYHADGVSPKTACMPTDWRGRARRVDVNTEQGITVLVPDPNDIAVAKLCAWREKDRQWLEEGLRLKVLDKEKIRKRLNSVIENNDTPDLAERVRRCDFLD